MSKKIMDINGLAKLIAKTFGTSKLLVQKNNNTLTVEPFSVDNPDSASQEIVLNQFGPGNINPEDFKVVGIPTKGLKFTRDEIYK
jgi:hypothetical protein